MHARASSIPSRVRATELILDEGRLFAQPGDVGEVLDAETYPDGVRMVMVRFRDAPAVTTCFLGQNVQPMLALVVPAVDLVEPEPAAAHVQAARPTWRPRRAFVAGFLAGVTALVAVLVWRACPTTDAGTLQVQPPSGLAPLLADVSGVEIGGALVGPRLPAREDIPND